MNLYLLRKCLIDGSLRIEVKMKLAEPISSANDALVILPPPPVVEEDCPICIEPISKPWGVVTPCGHPFHQSCWDQVVAKHWESDDDAPQLSCPVCRKVSTGFQPVFLDLGCTVASTADKRGSDLEEVVEEVNNDGNYDLLHTYANSNVVAVGNNNADAEVNEVSISTPPYPPPGYIDLDGLSLPSFSLEVREGGNNDTEDDVPSFESPPYAVSSVDSISEVYINDVRRTERVAVENSRTSNRLLRWTRRPRTINPVSCQPS